MQQPNTAGRHAERSFGRVPQFRVSGLDDEQRNVLSSLTGALEGRMPRSIVDDDGFVTGAMNYLMVDPDIGSAFVCLGSAIPRHLPPRLREVTILAASRALGCAYMCHVHRPVARAAGLSELDIDGILDDRDGGSLTGQERVAVGLVRSMVADRHVPDDLFNRANSQLGEAWLHEVVMLVGYYAMMNMALIAFAAPLPDGSALAPGAER